MDTIGYMSQRSQFYNQSSLDEENTSIIIITAITTIINTRRLLAPAEGWVIRQVKLKRVNLKSKTSNASLCDLCAQFGGKLCFFATCVRTYTLLSSSSSNHLDHPPSHLNHMSGHSWYWRSRTAASATLGPVYFSWSLSWFWWSWLSLTMVTMTTTIINMISHTLMTMNTVLKEGSKTILAMPVFYKLQLNPHTPLKFQRYSVTKV